MDSLQEAVLFITVFSSCIATVFSTLVANVIWDYYEKGKQLRLRCKYCGKIH